MNCFSHMGYLKSESKGEIKDINADGECKCIYGGTEEKKGERIFKLTVDRTATTVYTVYEQLNGEPVTFSCMYMTKSAKKQQKGNFPGL